MLALMGAEHTNPSIVNLLRIHAEFHHDEYCEKALPDRNGDMFSSGEFNPMRLKAKAQHSDTLKYCERGQNFQFSSTNIDVF